MTRDQECHNGFLSRLDGSQRAVWEVGLWLYNKGYTVTIPPQKRAPTADEWRKYSDGGDLKVEMDGVTMGVEVKHLTPVFTGPTDWRYGSNFYVDSVNTYGRKNPKPFAYFVLSHDYAYAGLIYTRTENKWTTRTAKDSNTEEMTTFWMCPISLIEWITITECREPGDED